MLELTKRAWFSALIFSRKTLLCNLCCSTWGFFAKTLRMSATIFCTEKRELAIYQKRYSTKNVQQHKCNCWSTRYLILTFILWTSKWLMARWVLIRQWVFWLRFLTTFTVNLWLGMWTASRSSPLTIVGDHHPTCYSQTNYADSKVKKFSIHVCIRPTSFYFNGWGS